MSRADSFWDSALDEVGHRLGDAQFFAYHDVECEFPEMLGGDVSELAVAMAGGLVGQFLSILSNRLQGEGEPK